MTRIIVRAVPERAEFIGYLKDKLPEAEWCLDIKRDAYDTFQRAMAAARLDPCVHMEEDVLICPGFVGKLEAVIQRFPFNVIQFFSMRGDDVTIGSRWDRKFIANLCVYFPKTYSAQILDYSRTWSRRSEHPTGTDLMVCDFLNERKEAYWIQCPNLVDHRVGKSVIDIRRSSRRVSKTFQPEV